MKKQIKITYSDGSFVDGIVSATENSITVETGGEVGVITQVGGEAYTHGMNSAENIHAADVLACEFCVQENVSPLGIYALPLSRKHGKIQHSPLSVQGINYTVEIK